MTGPLISVAARPHVTQTSRRVTSSNRLAYTVIESNIGTSNAHTLAGHASRPPSRAVRCTARYAGLLGSVVSSFADASCRNINTSDLLSTLMSSLKPSVRITSA